MGIRQRFTVIIAGTVILMAAMAFLIMRIDAMADLLNLSFLVFYLSLLGGLAWAFRPLALRMKSTISRYLVQSLGVIITFLVVAFFSYSMFLHFCVIVKWIS